MQLNPLHQVEAPYAPNHNKDTIPALLSPITEMRLMHADSWLPPMVPMNGGLPTPHVRPSPSQQTTLQQQQHQASAVATVVVLDELDRPATLSPGGMEDYQDLSKFMPLHQPCDSLVGESLIDLELTKDMRNENSDQVSNMWQREIGGNSMQTTESKNLNHGNTIMMDVRQQTASHETAQLDHAYPLVAGQQQQAYLNNNNNVSSNNNNNVNAKINASNDNYIFKNDNVWVSPIKGEQTFAAEGASDDWISSEKFENAMDQQKRTFMNSKSNNRQLFRENSQELMQIFEKADNFDLLSYIGEDDNLSPVDSVSTNYSHLTDSSVPRTPSNSSALVAVSPRTYEPVPLKPINAPTTTIDPLQARLLRASGVDLPRPQENSRLAAYNMPEVATTTTITGSMGYELRPIKQEKPESPEDDLTDLHSIERRSTRPRRTRVNSNVSQGSSTCSSRGRGRKRSRDDDSEDEMYRETREKNNEASRKSRMNKKQKEQEMSFKAGQLEKANKLLKMKVEHMEGVVNMLRNTLLQSALQRGEQKYF